MPGCCGTPVVQPRKFSAPAALPMKLKPPSAFACGAGRSSWLAVIFHEASGTSGRGSDASRSATVHGVFRSPLEARTLATSSGVANVPVFPKLLRTYEVTSAIH